MTVDELIAESATLADQVDGLVARLNTLTGHARGSGIEVTVNLDGKLVGLELTTGALKLGARELGPELLRLSRLAADEALASGMALLRDSLAGVVDADLLPDGVQSGHDARGPGQRYQR
jgi:hypothetical protein